MYINIPDQKSEQPQQDLIKINKPKAENKFVFFLKQWYLLIITILIVAIVTTTGTTLLFSSLGNSEGSYLTGNSISNTTNTSAYTPKTIYLESPTNGSLISEADFATLMTRKPLTVMIENLAGPNGARPQAGLQDADIVYETLAEGDITRFMGVFWNKTEDIKVMPIRSARKYFIDWLQEYGDPLYIHIGQANSTNENTDAYSALSRFNIKDLANANSSFSRDSNCEVNKATEHCAYSSTNRLWDIAKTMGYTNYKSFTSLTYKDDKTVDPEAKTTRDATNIKVEFEEDCANYCANWVYDSASNTYLRSQGTSSHTDQVTGKQLSTKTLVIQKTSIQEISSDALPGEHPKYHKIIKTVGSGDAWVIQDGKAVEATWKKDSLTGRTKYYDRISGKELSLDRGKMWITVTGNTPIIK